MRVVLDTNVLVSALMVRDRPPFQLVQAWLGDRLELITSEEQLEEFRRITRSARMRAYIASYEAGGLSNQLRALATCVRLTGAWPELAPDPGDRFLLALCRDGNADYLVTSDKRDLLTLGRYEHTQIVTARKMVTLLRL